MRQRLQASILGGADALTKLRDGPKARGAFLLRSILNPPWSLRIEDRAPLSMVAMVRGQAWVTTDKGLTARLRPGDIAIMRGPDPYTIADDPATPVQVVVGPGQRCSTRHGEDLPQTMHLGVRTWGDSLDGSTVIG
ncbi:MAG: cupin domain-containing protein [Pseudonocardiaceae bacterium]